jgi:hypothetical protein
MKKQETIDTIGVSAHISARAGVARARNGVCGSYIIVTWLWERPARAVPREVHKGKNQQKAWQHVQFYRNNRGQLWHFQHH